MKQRVTMLKKKQTTLNGKLSNLVTYIFISLMITILYLLYE